MRKNIFAILLGFAFCLAISGLIEVLFRINDHFSWIAHNPPVGSYSGRTDHFKSQSLKKELENLSVFQWHPTLAVELEKSVLQEGFDHSEKGPTSSLPGLNPFRTDITFRSKLFSNISRTPIYDALFTFDHFGRRITPVSLNSMYNIVLFGDSYTLGEGVDNDQTYPYQLALRRPAAQVYNLGSSGNGPNDVLFEMMMPSSSRLSDIPKRKTIVIYTYMDHHLERLICRSVCVYPDDWMLQKPYYAVKDGQVELLGRFKTDRKALNFFYGAIAHLELFRFFNVILPPQFSDRHLELFGAVVAKMKAVSKLLFPDSQFFMTLYPGDSNFYGPKVKAAAMKQGVDVISYLDIDVNEATAKKAKLPGDHHPSPVMHALFAHLLDRDLPHLEMGQ